MSTTQSYGTDLKGVRNPQYGARLKEVSNPEVQISQAGADVFRRLRDHRLMRITQEHEMQRAARPAQQIRDFKLGSDRVLQEAIPNFASHRQRILDEYASRLGKLRLNATLELPDGDSLLDDLLHEIVPVPRPPRGVGEFWWAGTSWWSTMDEFNVELPDDRIRIYGHLHWDGDDLIPGSFGYVENYVLSPDRFPTTGVSFYIEPNMHVGGVLSAFTGFYHGLWAADDKWCKVWENVRATVAFSTGEVLPSHQYKRQIMDLDDVSPVGQASKVLTMDQIPFIPFDEDLAARGASGTSILLQLERWYDVQLEGDSDLWFWNYRGHPGESTVPGPDNAVVCQTAPIFLHAW